MTEAASEVAPDEEPALYLCATNPTDARKMSVLETALWSWREPLPLTEDDIHSFTALAHVDKQELAIHAVTTVLLRSAGVEIGYKTKQESLRSQDVLQDEQEQQQLRVSKLSARLAAAITKYEATPPATNTAAEESRQQSLLSLHDNVDAAKTVANQIKKGIAEAQEQIRPYTEISAAVRTQEQAYNATYVPNGRPDISRILTEIVDPTADIQHPAVDLLHSVPVTLRNSMIVPERVLLMLLLKSGVAMRGRGA